MKGLPMLVAVVLLSAFFFVLVPGRAAAMAVATLDPTAAVLTGNLTAAGGAITTDQWVNTFDTSPLTNLGACSADHWGMVSTIASPPGGNIIKWNATDKSMSVTASPSGEESLGDGCGQLGYKWTVPLSMSFDFKVGNIYTAGTAFAVFVGFGSKTLAANTVKQGPQIFFSVASTNGTPYWSTYNYNGSTATHSPTCWGCIIANAWHHATLTYDPSTRWRRARSTDLGNPCPPPGRTLRLSPGEIISMAQ